MKTFSVLASLVRAANPWLSKATCTCKSTLRYCGCVTQPPINVDVLHMYRTKGLSSREAARGHATSVDGVLVTVTKFRINNFNKLLFPVDQGPASYFKTCSNYFAANSCAISLSRTPELLGIN